MTPSIDTTRARVADAVRYHRPRKAERETLRAELHAAMRAAFPRPALIVRRAHVAALPWRLRIRRALRILAGEGVR